MSHQQVDSPTANSHADPPQIVAEDDPSAQHAGAEARMAPELRWLSRVAWLPIPVLLVAIIAARVAGLRESYELTTLRLILSSAFYTLVALGTLFLIGRSFLASGAPGLLLLECGVILWSLAGTVGDAVFHGDANINVSIFNIGIALAGACHLSGAILALRPQRALRARGLWLGAAGALALGALGLATWAALAHRLPVFFIQGQGGTPVRYWVLISAIAMFVLSAGLLYAGPRTQRPAFTSWYALALLLLAVGLLGVMIQLSLGSVVNWLARTAQWLGGLYLLLAARAALRQSALPLLPPADRSHPVRYPEAIAVVAVLLATAVRLAFLEALGTRVAFITFYPAIIVAALYGGWRAGLLATILSALVADYFWIEPAGTLSIAHPADWLSIAVFLLSCTMISWITETMQRAQQRATQAEAAARAAAERARAEEALKTSRQQLRLITDAVPALMAFIGADGLYRMANAGYREWLGLDPAQLIGRHVRDVIGAQAWEQARPYVQRALAGEAVVYEAEMAYASTAPRWVHVTYTPDRDEQGVVRGFAVLATDITERKRAEEALRHRAEDALRLSEQEFRSLAEAMPQIVWATRPDGWNIYFNQQWVDYTGMTLEESYGHGWNTPFHPEDKQRAWEAWQRATQYNERYSLECRLRRADGTYRWFLIRGAPMRGANGEILKWFGTCTDIEEIKRSEAALHEANDLLEQRVAERTAALRRQEADLRDAQRVAHVGSWHWDAQTDVTTGTDELLRIYGLDPATQRMPDFQEQRGQCYPAEDWERVNAAVQETLRTGVGYELDVRALRAGMPIWVTTRGEAVRNAAGQIVGLRGTVQDITAHQQAEAASAEQARLLNLSFDAILVRDGQDRVVYWNQGAETVYGYTAQEAQGRVTHELLQTEFPEPLEAIRGRLAQEGRWAGELAHRRKDGTRVLMLSRWSADRDPTGRVIGVLESNNDITERKRAAESLRDSEERLRLALEAADFGTWDLDLVTGKAVRSLRHDQIFGYHELQPEWTLEMALRHVLPEDRQKIQDAHTPAEGKTQMYVEARVRRADGSIGWVMSTGRFQFDDRGCPVRMIGVCADITERKEAEEAVRRSEALLRAITDNSPDPIFLKDRDSRMLLANPATLAALRKSAAQVLGKTDEEFYDDAEAGRRVMANDRRVMESGQTEVVEEVVPGPGGARTFLSSKTPYRDAEGRVIGVIGVARDITERKRAEEALRLTQASVDGAAEMVAWFTPDGKVYYVNDATCRTLGYSREELLKMTALDFSPGFTQEQYEEHWREVRKRKSFTVQPLHRRKDGSTYTAEVLVNHVVYGGQEFLFAYGRDITERKRAEEKLRDSEAQFHVLTQNLHSAVALIDERGAFCIVNAAFRRMFDIPEDADILNVNNRDWGQWQVFDEHGALLDVDEHPVRKAALTRSAVNDRLVAVQPPANADRKWLLVTAEPILDAQGGIQRVVATYYDITERKRSEAAIQASLREKEVMLKEIHHRVKNNLQVIASLVDLQAGAMKEPGLLEIFADVRDRVRSMALVHEKLYQSESLAAVNFADYMQSLLSYLSRAHGGPGNTIKLNCDLQPVALSVEKAVPCGLIVNELVSNAYKHAFRGRAEGQITAALGMGADGRVRLRVGDDGVGLPAGLDWRRSSSLGLRLIQLLAGQLHASVAVHHGSGTEFEITFELEKRSERG